MLVSRLHIVGPPGSGKTSLAQRLAARLDAPAHDLDWVAYTEAGARPEDLRDADIARIAASPRWVTEGAYIGWTAPLLEAADAVVWLDVPWRVCAWRMLKRHALAELRRDNQHPGWRRLLGFMRYCRGYFDASRALPEQTTREATARQLAAFGGKVQRFTGSREVERFVAGLEPAPERRPA